MKLSAIFDAHLGDCQHKCVAHICVYVYEGVCVCGGGGGGASRGVERDKPANFQNILIPQVNLATPHPLSGGKQVGA